MVELSLPVGIATGFALGIATAYWTKTAAMRTPVMNVLRPLTQPHNLKMVMVVRTDLGMKKGKIAAQCSHAALGSYRIAMKNAPDILNQWEAAGEPKVTLRLDAKGEEPLVSLYKAALDAQVVACMIRDAGKTQIASGSATVVSIGPGPAELIDPLVKHLSLL